MSIHSFIQKTGILQFHNHTDSPVVASKIWDQGRRRRPNGTEAPSSLESAVTSDASAPKIFPRVIEPTNHNIPSHHRVEK